MAVARHPVARIAPPAPAIISASRARVGERNGERGNFPLILQCRQVPHRFRAQARPSAAGGHHPRTTRMSLGGGECRVGRGAARWDQHHHRRRGAESFAGDRSAPTNHRRRPPPTIAIATQSAAHAAGAGRAPRRSISYACRCPRARPPLSERCHKSPPHRIVETGWLSRATPWLAPRRRRPPSSAPRPRETKIEQVDASNFR